MCLRGVLYRVSQRVVQQRSRIAAELVSFGTFNDFVDRPYGIDKRIDKKFQGGSKGWEGGLVTRAMNDTVHWTGVAWVNRVRRSSRAEVAAQE